jgi:TolB-like protein/Tfp pilus assembly protein PilF
MPTPLTAEVARREDFRLGRWLVQPSLNRLTDEARQVQIEPRAMDVLAYLAGRAGTVVSREELIDAVWARQFVADATLSHAIGLIRQALGDDARRPRYIETIAKRGYRLLDPGPDPDVRQPSSAGGDPVAAAAPAARHAPPPSIAVLPFADMSPGRDQEYFCDGIAEETINALARLSGLKVAARTSSFAFRGAEDVREIARRLGVRNVLEGSVRKAGAALRITVQLIDTTDGCHLWSERFDRAGEDVFAIQDEIARGVVEALELRLGSSESSALGRRRTDNPLAHDAYLRGRHLLNRRRDFQRAIEHFETAVALDPSYAPPHAAIAEAFCILGLWGFLRPAAAFTRAETAASRAIELDDALAEAHAWLGFALCVHGREWERSGRHFETALRLPRPGWLSLFGFALYRLARGQRQAVREVCERLVELESFSAIALAQAASMHLALEELDRALALLDRALELEPALSMAHYWMGVCRAARGEPDEAERRLRNALDGGLVAAAMPLSGVLVAMGKRDAARRMVAELEAAAEKRYVPAVVRACAWAALGDRERGERLLETAEADREPMLTMGMIGSGWLVFATDWVREYVASRWRMVGPGAASP